MPQRYFDPSDPLGMNRVKEENVETIKSIRPKSPTPIQEEQPQQRPSQGELPLDGTIPAPLEETEQVTYAPFEETVRDYNVEESSYISSLLNDASEKEDDQYSFLQDDIDRAKQETSIDNYYSAKMFQQNIIDLQESETTEVEQDTRVGMAIMEGVKSSANQVGDLAEWAFNAEWDPIFELRDDLTETEELWKMGGEVGVMIGTTLIGGAALGVAKVAQGTYRALRVAGVGQKASRAMSVTAKWLPAELVSSQALLKPEDDRLVDMILDGIDAPDELKTDFKNNPLDSETQMRLINVVKDATDTAMALTGMKALGSVFSIVGRGFKRSRASALKSQQGFNLEKEMAGQGGTNRSQIAALEDHLFENGMTVEEITSKVRARYVGGEEVSTIARDFDTTVEVVTRRAIEDPLVAKRILGRHLMEDWQGIKPEVSLPSAKTQSITPSKSGRTILDDMNEASSGRQTDRMLEKAGITPKEQAIKNGWSAKVLKQEESSLSNWWHQKVTPTLGFDRFKAMKNLGRQVYGFDISAKGLIKAKAAGIEGIASSSGALADDLINTVDTRMSQMFAKGEEFAPVISSRFDDASERAYRLDTVDSFGNMLSKNDVTESEIEDIFTFMTAKSIEISSIRQIKAGGAGHNLYKSAQWDKDIALGSGRSAQFNNMVEDMRKFLQVPIRYEYQHGIKSADDLRRILESDVDEAGKAWYFPKETEASGFSGMGQPAATIGKAKRTRKGVQGLGEGNTGSELLSGQERIVNLFGRSIQAGETNKIKQAMYKEIEILRTSTHSGRRDLADAIAVRLDSSAWKNDVAFQKMMRDGVRTAIQDGVIDNVDPKLLKALADDTGKAVDKDSLIKAYGGLREAKVGDDLYDVVFHEGIPSVYKVKDPALKRAVESLGPQKVKDLGEIGNRLLKISKGVTRLKAKLITKTPTFIIPAQFREMISSSLFSTQTHIPGHAYLKGLFQGGKVIQEAMDGGFSISNTRYAQASSHLFEAANSAGTAKEKALAEMMGKQLNYLKRGVNAYNNGVNRIEVSAKLGEIMMALDKGYSPREAAFIGNQLMNFSRRSGSETIQLIGDHMLFFKPSAIGISKMAETITQRPLLAAVGIGGYVASDMAIDRLNSLYPESRSMPQWSTTINTLVPNLENWNDWPKLVEAAIAGDPSAAPRLDPDLPFFTIFGAHEMATTAKLTKDITYRFADMVTGEKTSTDTVTKAVVRFLTGTFGVFGSVPDIYAPFHHLVLTGKDQFGNQIVPRNFSQQGDVSTQYNDRTRQTAITFSEILQKGGFSVQPNNIDWLLNWALPGVGELALNATDIMFGDEKITKIGGRSKAANPLAYFPEALVGRIMVGHAELSNSKTVLYELQSSLYSIQAGLKVEGSRDDPRDVFNDKIVNRMVRTADGREILLSQMFPIIESTMDTLKLFNRDKVLLLNKIGHYSAYSDEQVRESLARMDKQTEAISREAIDYLVKYDLIGAADMLSEGIVKK